MKRKIVPAIMLTLLLTSMLTLAFNIQRVESEPTTIIVPDDYSSIQVAINAASDGDTIMVSSGTYYEQIIVNKAIRLIGENTMTTIIDAQGGGIIEILPDITVNSVVALTADNVTIDGFTIQKASEGIVIWNSNNETIINNIITLNDWAGIWLTDSSGSKFINNTIVSNNVHGIGINHCSDNTFIDNTVASTGWYGISLRNSGGNTFRNNNMTDNKYNFDVHVAGTLSDYIQDIDDSNKVDGKPIYYMVSQKDKQIPLDAGYVALINCTNITVEGLTLKNNGQGVILAYTNNSQIIGNNITCNSGFFLGAISLMFSHNNKIVNNSIYSNYAYGISIHGSNNNCFLNNIISNHEGYGILLDSSNSNNICSNFIANNGASTDTSGINIARSVENIITDNIVSNNQVGIRIMEGTYGNVIFHNNFINNTRQASFYMLNPGPHNIWDDGYPSGGNYWSDYTGIDQKSGSYQNETGSDGMGDTPYVIDLDNQDNYPLMNPWPSGWKLDFMAPSRHPIVDFAIYNGSLYAAADNKLYVKEGSSWNVIDAPTFVTSLEPYGDKLVVGGQGGLYCYDGTPFNLIFSVPTYIKVLGVYDNRLYAGTMLDNPPRLYYCNGSVDNPSDWYVDTDFSAILGFSGAFGSIDSFSVYDNVMYLSSAGKLYSFNGTDWSIAASYDDVYAFLDMQVYNGKLYLAARDQGWRKPMYLGGSGFSGRVIEFDGASWTTVLDHDYWIYSLGVYDDKLYAGTANKILTYNGTSWEVSFNATEGAYYAISMINYDSKIYAGMGNGCIFADPAPLKAEHETIVVPEFSSTTILAVFTAVTMLAAALTRKKRTKRFC